MKKLRSFALILLLSPLLVFSQKKDTLTWIGPDAWDNVRDAWPTPEPNILRAPSTNLIPGTSDDFVMQLYLLDIILKMKTADKEEELRLLRRLLFRVQGFKVTGRRNKKLFVQDVQKLKKFYKESGVRPSYF